MQARSGADNDNGAARRQRAYRRRQRDGQIVIEIAVREHDLAQALSAAGWLSEKQCLDRREVAHAIEIMLADWASAWRK